MVSLSKSFGLHSPNFNLPDEPRLWQRETLVTGNFADRRNVMAGNCPQQRQQADAPYDYVVASESNSNLINSAFRVYELAPGQNQRLLRLDDFQRRGDRVRSNDPRRIICQGRVHVD